MPSHYQYQCVECGHTERRYRNSTKCRRCSGDIMRLDSKDSTSKMFLDAAICPGCGWTGTMYDLAEYGACPDCGYENNQPPHWRLLTIAEMLEDGGEYNDVRMDRFLRAILAILETQKNSEKLGK